MSILAEHEIKTLNIIESGFSPDSLKETTYDLRLGEIYIDEKGKEKKLSDLDRFLIIEPHQAVTISSFEVVKLPLNVTGRFDLKLRWGLRGLMLQNGTQVEPGYWGRLYTLVFNLTSVPIKLCYQHDRVFAIEFCYVSGKKKVNLHGELPKEAALHIDRWAPDYPVQSGLQSIFEQVNRLKSLFTKVIPIGVTIAATLFVTFLPNFWSKSIYSKKDIEDIIQRQVQQEAAIQMERRTIDSLTIVLKTSIDSLKSKRGTPNASH